MADKTVKLQDRNGTIVTVAADREASLLRNGFARVAAPKKAPAKKAPAKRPAAKTDDK